MSFWTRAISLFILLLVIIYIIRIIRSRKIREEYVILWIFTAIATAIFIIFENFSVFLAKLIGAESDIVVIAFFAFTFILGILVHYSLRISELMDNIKELNQEIGLLKSEVEKLKGGN